MKRKYTSKVIGSRLFIIGDPGGNRFESFLTAGGKLADPFRYGVHEMTAPPPTNRDEIIKALKKIKPFEPPFEFEP